jgi:hypothetical protein
MEAEIVFNRKKENVCDSKTLSIRDSFSQSGRRVIEPSILLDFVHPVIVCS